MSEGELLEYNEKWESAILERDAESTQRILADDYALVLVQPGPAVMHRDQWLALLPGYRVYDWEVQERIVDVKDDVAAILQRVSMKASVQGTDRSGIFILSDVWRRIDGKWLVWRRHSTPISAGAMPAAQGADR